MAKARAGEEIYIDGGTTSLRLAKVAYIPLSDSLRPRYTEPRLASEYSPISKEILLTRLWMTSLEMTLKLSFELTSTRRS